MKAPALRRPPMVPTGMARNLPLRSYLNHEFPARRSTRPSPSTSNASMPSAYLAALLVVSSPAFPEKTVSSGHGASDLGFVGISARYSLFPPSFHKPN